MLLVLLLAIAPVGKEGDGQAFTSLTDPAGHPLADGRYAQHVRDGILHVEARYDFPDGRTAVERASLRLLPQIEQLSWDFVERTKEGELVRSYQVDFRTRQAVAERADQNKRWRDEVAVEPGKTFAGIGFMTAVKALREQLAPGQSMELQAIAFTPHPRSATVSIVHDGPETVRMAGRSIPADRFTIHPEIPAIARLFIHVPDQHIWLLAGGPPSFLRFEGPLVEPKDPVVMIDLVPGPSARSQPRAHRRRR